MEARERIRPAGGQNGPQERAGALGGPISHTGRAISHTARANNRTARANAPSAAKRQERRETKEGRTMGNRRAEIVAFIVALVAWFCVGIITGFLLVGSVLL